eukprot:Phypoly_transcript_12090.p1 GENE.Phypoly_transcript_12090~~Phypoly_transcript_12090.p1  ORF type:complete len:354 (+),score=62.89 Phypoly_transcript_12090:36-1064(+)
MAQYFPGGFVQPGHPHLQMQSLLHANAGKGPFSPMVLPQQSLLGAPPGGRGMPMNPFLNAAVFNRGVPTRGVVKPHIANYKKPALAPLPSSGDILVKLAKLIPELSNAEKSTANARTLNDLLIRGLNKQTAPNFYAALETLAGNIGKEGFNQQALWRVFEYAFLCKSYFSANPMHVENINKWKKDADILINPAKHEGRKRDLADTNNNTGVPSAAKRARTAATFTYKNYSIVDVGQQVEILQEELVAAREELTALRDQHKREIDFLYQHLGLTPPAPPSPEPEEEPEPEPAAEPAHTETETAESTENAEQAEGTETTEHAESSEEKVGEVEMAEPAASTEDA